jgi:DNA-binding response OmpR family regulator
MRNGKKILVIIDRRNFCEALSVNLESEGYDITMAFSIERAHQLLMSNSYDCNLILIDVKTKGKHGLDLIEKYSDEHNAPVIYLSKIKPLIVKDLFSQLETMLKITKDGITENIIKIGELHIDPSSKEAKIGNSIIPLTKTEFEILYLLATNPLKTYSRQQIREIVWQDSAEYVTEHTIGVHVAHMRKKLGGKAHCIVNRTGFGYKFDPNEE